MEVTASTMITVLEVRIPITPADFGMPRRQASGSRLQPAVAGSCSLRPSATSDKLTQDMQISSFA